MLVKDEKLKKVFTRLPNEKEYTYGTDPEIFAVDENGKLIPAFEYLPQRSEKNAVMYWDGFQGEFTTSSEFCLNLIMDDIHQMLRGIQHKVRLKRPLASLTIQNTFELSEETLKNTDRKYLEFGCKPSFNVYGTQGSKVPAHLIPYRWAGGHMHFGSWYKHDVPEWERIVSTIDALCGVFSVGLAADIDTPNRRQYYGQAGEFRLPLYKVPPRYNYRMNQFEEVDPVHGLEYRTLSNFWLCHPAIGQLVWELARFAVKIHKSRYLKLLSMPVEIVKDTINNCDVEQARKLVKANEPFYRKAFQFMFTQPYDDMHIKHNRLIADTALKACYEGLGSIIEDPNNIERNWLLNTAKYPIENVSKTSTIEWVSDGGSWIQCFSSYALGINGIVPFNDQNEEEDYEDCDCDDCMRAREA